MRWLAIITISLVPFAVGAVSRVRNAGTGDANGDRALIALATRAVWSHPVLLGPYSRFGWHHPGPLYFYLLALPSRLFGGSTIGLVLGVTLVNFAAAIGVVIVAVRRGGWALGVWTALVLGVYVAALGRVAFDDWNPSATLLPFALVLALSWSVACLDVWAIPWLALAGTFCVQTHVGLAPGVFMAFGVGGASLAVRLRRARGPADPDRSQSSRRALAVAGLVLFVLWLPPIVEQFTSAHGNLASIGQFFADSGSQHPLGTAAKNAAFQITLLPRGLLQNGQITDLVSHTSYRVELAVSCLTFATALVLAIRAKASVALTLLVLVALEFVVAVYSVTKIVGAIDYYLVQWISAVGLMLWVALGAAVIPAIGRAQWPRIVSRRIAGVGLVLVVSVVALQGAVHATVSRPAYSDPDLHQVVESILAAPRRSPNVVLELKDPSAWPIFAGTAFELAEHGLDVRVVRSPVTTLLFEPSYVGSRPTHGSRLVFLDGRAHRVHEVPGPVVGRAGRWVVKRTPNRASS